MRSTNAPLISAGVMIANFSWKAMKTRCGTLPLSVPDHAVQEQVVEAADEPAVRLAEGERVAEHHPLHRHQRQREVRVHEAWRARSSAAPSRRRRAPGPGVISSTSADAISIQAVSPVSACASVAWAQAVRGRQRTAAQRARPAGRTVGRSMGPTVALTRCVCHRCRDVATGNPSGPSGVRPPSMRRALPVLVLLVGCANGSPRRARRRRSTAPRAFAEPLQVPAIAWSSEEQAVHVLDRLAYGPSPRDLADVQRDGSRSVDRLAAAARGHRRRSGGRSASPTFPRSG